MEREFHKEFEREFHEPRFHGEKPHKPGRPKPRPHVKQVTTLFEDKQEMIRYVNEKGQEGHKIDIFKIEDGLYKVVVVVREPRRERI